MSGYVIYHYNITDRSQIDELTRQSLPVNEKYGAEVLIGSPVKAVEGDTHSHIVVLKFDSFESAQTYHHSPENQSLSKLRNRITKGWAAIVPGDCETQAVVDSGYFQ